MGPRGLVLGLGLGVVACRPSLEVIAPELDAQTLIYIEEGPAPRAFVVRAEPGATADFFLDEGQGLWLLAYRAPPEGLGLEVGPLTIWDERADDRRPLPRPDEARRMKAEGGGDWQTDDEALEATLPKWWIANLTPEACVSYGGCLSKAEPEDARVCNLPCEPLAPRPPLPALPPDAPRLDCITGWDARVRVADTASVSFCIPPEPLDCPSGEMATIDGRCVPIDAPCPAGKWPEVLPDDRPLWFVDPRAAPGGDGSQVRPFQTILSAVLAASPGDGIVLSQGYHPSGRVYLPRDLLLLGTCTQGSIVVGALGVGSGNEVRSLAIDDTNRPQPWALVKLGQGEARLVGVEITATSTGVEAHGGTLSAVRLKVRAPNPVFARPGAVAFDQVDLGSTDGVALRGRDAGASSVANFVISGGIRWSGEGALELDSGLISASTVAIAIRTSGCVNADKVRVSGGVLQDRGCFNASELMMYEGGIELDGSTFTGTDVSIETPIGPGIRATGSNLSLERVAISGAMGAGLRLEGSQSVLRSLIVLDTGAASGAELDKGDGVASLGSALRPSSVAVSRAVIARSAASGLVTLGEGQLIIGDLRVEDTAAEPGGTGIALASIGGLHLELDRIEVHRAAGTGIWIQGPLDSTSKVGNLRVDQAGVGVRFPALPDDRASENQLPALGPIAISNSQALGLCVGIYWSLVASSLSVTDTGARSPTMADFCFGQTSFTGVGVSVAPNAILDLTRFEVARSQARGFYQHPLGELTIREGTVADNPVAIDADGRVLIDFMDRVRFVGNGQLLAPH